MLVLLLRDLCISSRDPEGEVRVVEQRNQWEHLEPLAWRKKVQGEARNYCELSEEKLIKLILNSPAERTNTKG